jgi:signal recognition particle receptor subunit beta
MKAPDHKIIFTGPVGSGKTTAIATISDIPPVLTDSQLSKNNLNQSNHTTVAMDYGILNLDQGTKVHLYGTPGLERFDFMWEILTENAIGLILLLDNTRPDTLKDMVFFLDAFSEFLKTVPLVIGVTKMDVQGKPFIDTYQQNLLEKSIKVPVFEVDVRRKSDVKSLLMALLFSIDPGLES